MNFSSPKIMGILNVTPDSFSDGGRFVGQPDFERKILQMIDDGADIIDMGGESTGPNSADVSPDEEMGRVKPVIDWVTEKKLTNRVLFSIDTYKSEVARYALENGFGMVNDVTALRGDPKMIDVLLKYRPYVVLMYSKDNSPRTTREEAHYDDVMAAVKNFLKRQAEKLVSAGFPKERILVDPGMGMFVSAEPKCSFEIIDRLGELKSLGYPILIGVSRKSFLGGPLKDRDTPSAQWSLKAILNGASVVRMHEIKLLKKLIKKV